MSAGCGLGRLKSNPPPIVVEDSESSLGSKHPTQTSNTSSPSSSQPTRPNLPTGQPSKRKQSPPTLEWRENRPAEGWAQGRILIIDYLSSSHAASGERKIQAQELGDIESLRRFYRAQETCSTPAALRVMHVQNAPWATRFLLRKFNMDASDDLVGTTFGRWARYHGPQMHGGKPVLGGKTFRAQRDPWRGVSRTAFGADYLKYYARGKVGEGAVRLMQLNRYDAEDVPCYGFDVLVQRLGVYVQVKDGAPGQKTIDPDIPNPYNEGAYDDYQRLKNQYGNIDAAEKQEKHIPKLQCLDNNNTVIIFETSQSGSVKDTLIGARQELESRWRRLSFHLPHDKGITRSSSPPYDSHDEVGNENENENDTALATETIDFILRDIFNALAFSWQKLLSLSSTHVAILQDKIYQNSADETRAAELYLNGAQWLKVERLLYTHLDILAEMCIQLLDLAPPPPPAPGRKGEKTKTDDQDKWLATAADLERLPPQWDRNVSLPTTALSDLMYKSIGIRDAHHSLQLGLSMWRLSWISFIFLPLTFTVGFFGMNVSLFTTDASLPLSHWFFVSAPLLALLLAASYAAKHSLAARANAPRRRAANERHHRDMAMRHPLLWTARGPRVDVVPVGVVAAAKWRLLASWFGAEKVARNHPLDVRAAELGVVESA